MRSNPHVIHSQLLQQISDPTLTKDERAQLKCQLAKRLEEVGSFEAAREAMAELWAGVGERPVLDELEKATAAEVLLRAGTLTGWIGSTKQIEGSQEAAKNLLTESITKFEALHDVGKVAEAQTEVAFCYWRQGSFDEARVWLQEALGRLPLDTNDEVRAVALVRLAIVERSAKRFHDALRIHVEAAPLFQRIGSEVLKGKFHYGFAYVLSILGSAEGRSDYMTALSSSTPPPVTISSRPGRTRATKPASKTISDSYSALLGDSPRLTNTSTARKPSSPA